MVSRCLLLLAVVGGRVIADEQLLDFAVGPALATIQSTDVRVTRAPFRDGQGLRLETGHQADWPGITLPAPKGHWDLSRRAYVELPVKNLGERDVTIYCRVDSPGADGWRNCATGQATMAPGVTVTLRTTLRHREIGVPAIKLFGMRGYPPTGAESGTLDARNVTGLVIYVPKPTEDHQFLVGNPRAGGEHTPHPPWPAGKPFLPMIDTFGQYLHREWPGKTHSLEELQGRGVEEEADLAAHPGPDGWDQYGGWAAGPQLEATGFFRTAQHRGKWWLVDPDGRLFFSHGIDSVGVYDATPVTEREDWFADYPATKPDLAEFVRHWSVLKGHYAGLTPVSYDFARANLRRKYGPNWRGQSLARAHQRLRSWGLNTLASWVDRSVYELRRTPYTAFIRVQCASIEGSAGYWGKFPDVFDPSFPATVERVMNGEIGHSAGDRWCIGYFVDNEMSWGDAWSLALATLKSPAGQPAKQVFIRDLRAKYGDIAELNQIWATHHASWDALLETTALPEPAKAGTDLSAFYTKVAVTYFRTVRDAIRAVAPRQLYLGCRFAKVNPLAAAAAAKYCDVVSFNLYRQSVAGFRPPCEADVPLIVGEFHFGALDRGMFHTGLVPVDSQAARAEQYRSYVEGVLAHPQFLGCGWFKYQDEPTTGRVWDEENYQIGFVDVCDTPYPETLAAAREVGARMYALRSAAP